MVTGKVIRIKKGFGGILLRSGKMLSTFEFWLELNRRCKGKTLPGGETKHFFSVQCKSKMVFSFNIERMVGSNKWEKKNLPSFWSQVAVNVTVTRYNCYKDKYVTRFLSWLSCVIEKTNVTISRFLTYECHSLLAFWGLVNAKSSMAASSSSSNGLASK